MYGIYFLAFALPLCAMLYLQYLSIGRQSKTIRDLRTANLLLSGDRIAELIEQEYYGSAADVLHDYASELQSNPLTRRCRVEELRSFVDPLGGPPLFESVFVVERDGSISQVCDAAAAGHEFWKRRYASLLQAHETDRVLTIGIAGPPVAQLFYIEVEPGRYVIGSLNMHLAMRDRSNDAYILGLPNRARIIDARELPKPTEAVIRFPTLFPFWRLAVSSLGDKEASSSIPIFAALSVMTLLLLAFTVILFTRASWRQWRLNDVREEFIRGVSHDLKTPVASLSMFSEMLLDSTLKPDEVLELHRLVNQETQRLARLVTNVLEISKLKHGSQQLQFSCCNPKPILEESIAFVEAQARPQGFRFALKQPEHLPLIWCDRTSVIQCLIDLLDNAVKYSGDSREIDVEVAARKRTLAITVRDHGIGIPQNEISRIFDEFHRGGNAHKQKGYGLGLYLVRSVMDAHHGRVEVRSDLNRGSEFRLILPVGPCRRS